MEDIDTDDTDNINIATYSDTDVHEEGLQDLDDKDQKLTTGFEKILTFCLARGFDLVLSLTVTTPFITPVMDIS